MDIKESNMSLPDKLASRLFIELNDVLNNKLMHITVRPETNTRY